MVEDPCKGMYRTEKHPPVHTAGCIRIFSALLVTFMKKGDLDISSSQATSNRMHDIMKDSFDVFIEPLRSTVTNFVLWSSCTSKGFDK